MCNGKQLFPLYYYLAKLAIIRNEYYFIKPAQADPSRYLFFFFFFFFVCVCVCVCGFFFFFFLLVFLNLS